MTDFTGTVTWIGHGSSLLVTGGGTRILIDAFIESNPTTPDALKGDGLGDLDAIFITHAHGDHIADLEAHQQRTGAKVYAIVELTDRLTERGMSEDVLVGFGKGGTV